MLRTDPHCGQLVCLVWRKSGFSPNILSLPSFAMFLFSCFTSDVSLLSLPCMFAHFFAIETFIQRPQPPIFPRNICTKLKYNSFFFFTASIFIFKPGNLLLHHNVQEVRKPILSPLQIIQLIVNQGFTQKLPFSVLATKLQNSIGWTNSIFWKPVQWGPADAALCQEFHSKVLQVVLPCPSIVVPPENERWPQNVNSERKVKPHLHQLPYPRKGPLQWSPVCNWSFATRELLHYPMEVLHLLQACYQRFHHLHILSHWEESNGTMPKLEQSKWGWRASEEGAKMSRANPRAASAEKGKQAQTFSLLVPTATFS